MEAGETPTEAAARELREEVGLRVDPDALALLDTHSPSYDSGKHMVVIDYVVSEEAVEGTPDPGPEVASVEWLRPAASAERQFLASHEGIVRAARERLAEQE